MTIGMAIISDDFTGGLMVASHLERDGVRCPYITSLSALEALAAESVVVVATRARFLPSDKAVAVVKQICDVLDAKGIRQVFYKYCATFDSTEKGNIGPCADYLVDRYGMDRMVFSPGFPDFRIFVHEGYMFYKDRLISESIKRFDPLTPMNDPDMARVLRSQTAKMVGLLPHRVLHEGARASMDWIDQNVQEGVAYFMADSVDNDDVELSAILTKDWPAMTGGDGIAIALARHFAHGNTPVATPLVHGAGAGVVLAGSCGHATLEQLDHFEKLRPVLRINLVDVVESANAIERATAWALERLHEGPVAITTADDPEPIKQIQARLGVMEAARLAESTLSSIGVNLYKAGVRRFVVAGGETSGAVVNALGVRSMRVAPFDSLGAGVCVATDPEPVSFFLKPGKVGTPDVFTRALNAMGNQ